MGIYHSSNALTEEVARLAYLARAAFTNGSLVRAIFIAFYYIAIIIKIKNIISDYIFIIILLFLVYLQIHQVFQPLELEMQVIYSQIRNFHHFATATPDCYALKISSCALESYVQ